MTPPRESVNHQAEIDKIARQLVETTSKLFDDTPDMISRTTIPDDAPVLGRLRGAQRELEALGFDRLGDYAPCAERGLAGEAFTRMLLRKDGTVFAKLFRAPGGAADEPPVEAVILGTRFGDESSLCTLRGFPARFPEAPQFQEWYVDDDMPVGRMVREHDLRCAATGSRPIPFADVEDILGYLQKQDAITRAWRRNLGVHFYELFMRRLTGDRYDLAGAPLVESIRAHPWWLKNLLPAG